LRYFFSRRLSAAATTFDRTARGKSSPGAGGVRLLCQRQRSGLFFHFFCDHKDYINELSPVWYRLQGDGALEENVDDEALAIARESGIKESLWSEVRKKRGLMNTNFSVYYV
jgi:hypothetical protein